MILTHFIAFGFWPGADGGSTPLVTTTNPSRLYVGIAIRMALALAVFFR